MSGSETGRTGNRAGIGRLLNRDTALHSMLSIGTTSRVGRWLTTESAFCQVQKLVGQGMLSSLKASSKKQLAREKRGRLNIGDSPAILHPIRHSSCAPMEHMYSETIDSSSVKPDIEVLLDGLPVELPRERRSLTGIRSLLETLALQKHRVLSSFRVDGDATNVAQPLLPRKSFGRVEGETLSLEEMPLQLIRTAMQQTAEAQALVKSAVVLVLINDGVAAREFWWKMTGKLKEPLITMSLVPTTNFAVVLGVASLDQLRKWQMEQLAAILQSVDEACWSEDPSKLSNVLEQRALPWLEALERSLDLWHEALSIGVRTVGLAI